MGLTALAPGDPAKLGRYWLAGRLGVGGQGIVYEAYDDEGHRVAIKALHGDVTSDPGLRARFVKEAQAARRVASFCTARVLAADFDAPRPYIVSEFVAGPNLREAVREAGPYTGETLHRLAVALATALTAIHQAGVVHRDVKPENVLLGPDGPRMIDFGVARTEEMSLTPTGIVAGTPTFMAPEVFVGQRAGTPADVFAWGGVSLFAATGEDPFKAESLGGVMHRVLTVDPDLGDVAEPLRSLMAAALAKDAADRPTARELLMDLLGGTAVREAVLPGTVLPGASTDGDPGPEVTTAGEETDEDLAAGARAGGRLPPPGPGAPALGLIAEEAFAGLSPAAQADAPGVLLRMVGDDSVHGVECRPEDEPVIARFADAGLLVRRGTTAVPAGAALPRAWPRMREWLEAERDGLPVHRRLAEAARSWEERGRAPADLYRGAALREALHWAATERRYLGVDHRERRFLDAASAVERRRLRGRRLATAAMAVLLVFSLGVTVIALRQQQVLAGQAEDLERQRDESAARAVAARADGLRDSDPRTAMRLSVAAWRIAQVPEARSALQAALAQAKVDVFTDPDATSGASYVLTPDARTLVRAGGGEVRMYDVVTHRPVRSFGGTGKHAIVTAASPDGSTVEVGGRLWDSATGRAVGPAIPEGATAELESPRRLVSVIGPDRLVMRPLDGGEPLVSSVGFEPEATVSPDGRWAAVAERQGEVEVWNLTAGKRAFTRRTDGPVTSRGEREAPRIAFSPDGATLAVGGDTSIVLLDPARGKQRGEPFASVGDGSLRFSPDGRFLAEQAEEALYLWKVADRTISARFPVTTMGKARFTADGRTLRYPTEHGSVVSIDISAVTHTDTLNVPRERSGWESAVFAPGGRVLAYANLGVVRLWDPTRLAPIGGPLAVDAGSAGAFSPDGRTLAIPRRDGSAVTLWDVATRRGLATLDTGTEPIATLAFSPDGRTLVAGVGNGKVRTWDVRTGGTTGTAGLVPAGSRAFRPDVRATAFTPDGRVLALSLDDQRVLLWDAGRGTRLGALGVQGAQRILRFSPDGRLLVTVGDDVRLWDVAAQREIGVLPVGANVLDLAFGPDGRTLNAVAPDGSVGRLPVDPSLLAESVCARAGSGLPEREWRHLIPGVPYRETCT
ncbi:WD40 repeat domain-containing serine/threonine protein kinase [Streptosporangium sp. CA-135522]|uniref:WD40 repeat domain-containing serine/threonine protein kinase n=1 Tax=Streptosporangium sp. CA-135522 TaxID=3240072 RepID=UPI003D8FD3B5